MDFIKKKNIKTLNELTTFDDNKAEIERQIRAFGLDVPEDFNERFRREIAELQREHERKMKKIKIISRICWAIFIIGFVLQIVALLIKINK